MLFNSVDANPLLRSSEPSSSVASTAVQLAAAMQSDSHVADLALRLAAALHLQQQQQQQQDILSQQLASMQEPSDATLPSHLAATMQRQQVAMLTQLALQSLQGSPPPELPKVPLPPGLTLLTAADAQSTQEATLPEVTEPARIDIPDLVEVKRSEAKQPEEAALAPDPRPEVTSATGTEPKEEKGSRATLRAYLQELRDEDPRRIFVARRINKLGFRSKAILARHYSKYSEEVRVYVAHSKVRPFRNTMQLPKTRPGNLGIIVMKRPEDVQRVLALGPEQTVKGAEILVHMFDRVKMGEEQEDSPAGLPAAADKATTENDSQSAGSSTEANTSCLMSVEDWRRSRSVAVQPRPQLTTSCDNLREGLSGTSTSARSGSGSEPVSKGSSANVPEQCAAESQPEVQHPPPQLHQLQQMHELRLSEVRRARQAQLQRQSQQPMPLAPMGAPGLPPPEPLQQSAWQRAMTPPSESDSTGMLSNQLDQVLQELSRLGCQAEQAAHVQKSAQEESMQAAMLATWAHEAQMSLKLLEERCTARLSELSYEGEARTCFNLAEAAAGPLRHAGWGTAGRPHPQRADGRTRPRRFH